MTNHTHLPTAQVMGTDYTFTCPTRYAVKALIQQDEKNNPVWLYNFNHSLSFDGWGKEFSFCDGHSCKDQCFSVLYNLNRHLLCTHGWGMPLCLWIWMERNKYTAI